MRFVGGDSNFLVSSSSSDFQVNGAKDCGKFKEKCLCGCFKKREKFRKFFSSGNFSLIQLGLLLIAPDEIDRFAAGMYHLTLLETTHCNKELLIEIQLSSFDT
jgi:hypothetical protein